MSEPRQEPRTGRAGSHGPAGPRTRSNVGRASPSSRPGIASSRSGSPPRRSNRIAPGPAVCSRAVWPYRIFLWQIPLALFLLSAFGLAAELAGDDPAYLARQVGLTAALSAAIAQGVAASEHGRVWFLLLGAFLTVWAGRGMFSGFRLVSQLAWRARATPYSSLRGSLLVTAFGLGFLTLQSFFLGCRRPWACRGSSTSSSGFSWP